MKAHEKIARRAAQDAIESAAQQLFDASKCLDRDSTIASIDAHLAHDHAIKAVAEIGRAQGEILRALAFAVARQEQEKKS